MVVFSDNEAQETMHVFPVADLDGYDAEFQSFEEVPSAPCSARTAIGLPPSSERFHDENAPYDADGDQAAETNSSENSHSSFSLNE